ncbi:MAG: T6SS effector amidase Tae4 family protein [Planctomycetaceae bacterium]
MAATGRINVNFELLKENYPDFHSLSGEPRRRADKYKAENPKWTSCVIQMSVALNAVQELIPKENPNRKAGNDFWSPHFYMLSVVDFNAYLTKRYGAGELIKGTLAEKKAALNGRQGILTIGNSHTELWDTDHHVQNGKDRKALVVETAVLASNSPIRFWEVNAGTPALIPVPSWLPGWWEVDDGTVYYYSFSRSHTVTWTEKRPKNIALPAADILSNSGVVSVNKNGAAIVITWNPRGGGTTIETFTRLPSIVESMAGQSNRYSPLKAVKLK